jgi:hypothetical protein
VAAAALEYSNGGVEGRGWDEGVEGCGEERRGLESGGRVFEEGGRGTEGTSANLSTDHAGKEGAGRYEAITEERREIGCGCEAERRREESGCGWGEEVKFAPIVWFRQDTCCRKVEIAAKKEDR